MTTTQTQTKKKQPQTVKEFLEELKKAENEKDALSLYFLLQQAKDLEEYSRGQKDKNFYLSNTFKNECVTRWYNNNMKNIIFHVTPRAGKALLGLAFLTESFFKMEYIPQNKDTIAVHVAIDYESMSNGQIHFYNSELNINIPEHNREEENELEQEFLNSFIQSM
nr:MAG TPA: hypothetical protein [Caudoviricetes sp.]